MLKVPFTPNGLYIEPSDGLIQGFPWRIWYGNQWLPVPLAVARANGYKYRRGGATYIYDHDGLTKILIDCIVETEYYPFEFIPHDTSRNQNMV